VYKDETPVPYVKGEGPLQMVADMVSAGYGWLQSPDGKEEAVSDWLDVGGRGPLAVSQVVSD
jgi:hypothetical protein